MSQKRQKRRGRKPSYLTIEDDWEKAIKGAVQKEKPKGGWPKMAKNPKI
jgi:hypothetical protein